MAKYSAMDTNARSPPDRSDSTRRLLPGGCAFGNRPLDYHASGFRALGALWEQGEDAIRVAWDSPRPTFFALPYPSVGATVNAILMSVSAEGETVIYGASRLRIKESDRLATVCAFLSAIGAEITQTDDGLIIKGKNRLHGGEVSSANDHRIAMSASVASAVCEEPVVIDQAEATAKSYPSFWDDMALLNIRCKTL